ncbi:hypothetical protein ACHQM5_016091 [Ranunculus cassubicifolius]
MVSLNSPISSFPALLLSNHHYSHHLSSSTKFQCFCKQQLNITSSASNTITYNNNLMYSHVRNDKLENALKVFDEMPERNQDSWSIIISAYSHCGKCRQALDLFEKMLWEGLWPNECIMQSLFTVAARGGDGFLGRQLHGWLIRCGVRLEGNIICTSIITMYSVCGEFDNVLQFFYRVAENVCLSERCYASVVNACSSRRVEKYGKVIHGRIVKDGVLDATVIGNCLVTFYAKCGNVGEANRVFHTMSRKDVVSWNSIIAGNEQNGEHEIAMRLYCRMLKIGVSLRPNRITFLSLLSAVSAASDLKYGTGVHAHIIRSGMKCNTSIVNSLITMYSRCEEVRKAELVFEMVPSRDMVTWNSMLSGYVQNEQAICFFNLLKKMLVEGIEPDNHTLTMVLSASASLQSELEYSRVGRAVHGYIVRRVTSERLGVSTFNSILNMYAKTSRVAVAKKIFERMHERDSYTLNAMMEGYSLSGNFDEAVRIFLEMHEQGLPSDYMTFSILLTNCARLVSFNLGEQFHAFVVKEICNVSLTHPASLLSVHNALISMYAKCGNINDANRVFVRMNTKDVFSWTAMITGYAHHGMAIEAFQLFEEMKQAAIKPNGITFLGLLTACAHAGLVEEGMYYFRSINEAYGLNPSIEHYACMVDLFGRSGQLELAEKWVNSGATLFKENCGECLNLWKVLLGACHAHKQLKLGVHAATKILESDPEDETTHVLLLNLYAASGMWEDAMRVRRWMRDKGLKKQETGCSWIEAKNQKHVFMAGDIFHPQREEIYVKLDEVNRRCKEIGYEPMTEFVLQDVDESQKEAILSCHSEKLAVSFALLQGGPGRKDVIRVMKNLRICGDCHNWMKFSSQIERRDIVVRDSRRFHIFKKGSCSCGDYW